MLPRIQTLGGCSKCVLFICVSLHMLQGAKSLTSGGHELCVVLLCGHVGGASLMSCVAMGCLHVCTDFEYLSFPWCACV